MQVKNSYKFLTLLLLFEHVAASNLVKDVAAFWVAGLVVTTLHELGHALTAKALWQSPIDINVGGKSKTVYIFKVPMLGFTLRGVNPALGYSYSEAPRDATPLSKMMVSLMGPVFGITATLAGLCILQSLYPCRADYPLSKIAGLYSLVHHIVLQLPPWGLGFDGDSIYAHYCAWRKKIVCV